MQNSIKAIQNIVFHTGRSIPQFGFGTYQLRGNDCIEAVKIALKLGYRHIDTASFYRNQKQIREAIKLSGLKREQLYITSKLNTSEAGYQKAIKGCNGILQKLGTPYLDLLLIHWPGVEGVSPSSNKNAEVRRQTWRAMIDLKKQGKVRDIGVSNFLVHHLEDLAKHSAEKPVINQFELHPLLWEEELIGYCRNHNIVIEGYSPLARNEQKLMKNKLMLSLAKKYSKTAAQIALRWAIQLNFVTIPKSKTEKYISANFEIFDFNLEESEVKNITKLHDGTRTCWNPHDILY